MFGSEFRGLGLEYCIFEYFKKILTVKLNLYCYIFKGIFKKGDKSQDFPKFEFDFYTSGYGSDFRVNFLVPLSKMLTFIVEARINLQVSLSLLPFFEGLFTKIFS
jgi:hypothetical protein